MNPTEEAAAERQRLAEKLAFERGVREGVVDSQLDQHKERLDAINGSLTKIGSRMEALAYSVAKMDQAQDRRDAVSDALQTALDRHKGQTFTVWQRTAAVIVATFAIVTPIVSLALAH